jgi:hypothetical protein
MKLDPDEKELLESVERGEWQPAAGDEMFRTRDLARKHLRADVEAGCDGCDPLQDGGSTDEGDPARDFSTKPPRQADE